jgi:hypothetical protein
MCTTPVCTADQQKEMPLNESPKDRWTALSSAFGAYMDKSTEGEFQAGRFATMIARELITHVGTTQDRLTLYQYEPSDDPRYDKFEDASSGFEAVSQLKDGRWGFAMALDLERAPNAYPRLKLRWTMFIDLTDGVEVEIGISGTKLPLRHVEGTWQVGPICQRIYQDIQDSLLAGASGGRSSPFRIGFI